MSTKKLQIVGSVIATDETLAQSGVAADAKAVGDALAELITVEDIDTICGSSVVAATLDNEVTF